MGDTDVAGVLGCGVIVGEVDTWLIVFVNEDRAFDKLSWHIFNHINDPQEDSGDEG